MDDRSRKIAVTGSTGLLGGHLVAELLRDGFRNIVLPVRDLSAFSKLEKTLRNESVDPHGAELHVVETKLNNPIALAAAFAGVDTVYHCAATVSLGGLSEDLLVFQNTEIASHVVDASLKSGVRKLIHVSSIITMGNPGDEVELYDESMYAGSLAGLSAYAAGKILSEYEVVRGSFLGLKTVTVNPALIIGTSGGKSSSAAIIPLLAAGIPFYTEGITAFVDVRDVARAMVMLAGCDKAYGQRFILAGANITYRDLLTEASRVSGHKPPWIRIGKRLLRSVAAVSAWVLSLMRRPPLFSADTVELLYKKHCYDGSKIKKFINFEYTPVSETIDRVIRQYRDERG